MFLFLRGTNERILGDVDRTGATSRSQPTDGDIVVMTVASHYHVGRVQLQGKPWVSIEAMDSSPTR